MINQTFELIIKQAKQDLAELEYLTKVADLNRRQLLENEE